MIKDAVAFVLLQIDTPLNFQLCWTPDYLASSTYFFPLPLFPNQFLLNYSALFCIDRSFVEVN